MNEKILVADEVSQLGIRRLESAGFQVDIKTGLTEDELSEIIVDYNAIIIRSSTRITEKILSNAKNLKIIARAGVGVDNINVEAATKYGVVVVNSPEGNIISAAEHTFGLIISLLRNIPQSDRSVRNLEWKRNKFTGHELYRKTIGIIGLGKVGSNVAKYSKAFGMKVIGFDPYISFDRAKEMGISLMSLDDVFKEADVITVHVPKTKETYHLVNKERISLMKKGSYIVNAARGGVVDETAVADALKSGHLAGLASDVFEVEPVTNENHYVSIENTVLTPHIGAATKEAQVNVILDVVEQVIAFFEGRVPHGAVNLPAFRGVSDDLLPWIDLAERLGKFIKDMVSQRVSKIEIIYYGDIAKKNISPVSVSVLKGYLIKIKGNYVSFVNALPLANDLGIKYTESKESEDVDFKSVITVRVITDSGVRSVSGTILSDQKPRIIGIDDYRVDTFPEGYLLISRHKDKPGIIGRFGTVLGANKINIAGMQLGRNSKSGLAVMILSVDSEVNDGVLENLINGGDIEELRLIYLS